MVCYSIANPVTAYKSNTPAGSRCGGYGGVKSIIYHAPFSGLRYGFDQKGQKRRRYEKKSDMDGTGNYAFADRVRRQYV